jgi:gamma-glutamylcyclotransferase
MKHLFSLSLFISRACTHTQITMATSAPDLPPNTTIYFGYGSNLWLHQMHLRCPNSTYLGIARLNDYKWIINERGYANVVELPSATSPSSQSDFSTVVFGLVYALDPTDEAALDKNEGVPVAYTKEHLTVDFWAGRREQWIDVDARPSREVEMLVYIDRKRVKEDSPREEYVIRMNRGIVDALEVGVPKGYVRDVMRRFIREDEDEDGGVEEFAKEQARGFKDESGVFG